MGALKFNNICVQVDSSISMELLTAEGFYVRRILNSQAKYHHICSKGSAL